MYSCSDLKKGLKLLIDGEPHVIAQFDFTKPGCPQYDGYLALYQRTCDTSACRTASATCPMARFRPSPSAPMSCS